MASAVSNLLIYQGADFNIDFTVENDNGTPFNLTGYTVACKIKKHYTSSSFTTVTAGMKSGRYVYDVVITSASGIKSRVLEGTVSVLEGVTI